MMECKNTIAFFSLVKAGLWEKYVNLPDYNSIDFKEVYRLASEQAVVGLVVAGIEQTGNKITQEFSIPFLSAVIQLEQRNTAMNFFVSRLVKEIGGVGIEPLLVKGQGVAQCYERPLWRACGDVDLFICEADYRKLKSFLAPKASDIEKEDKGLLHVGMTIGEWIVELHGSLRGGVLNRIDQVVDEIQKEVFEGHKYRTWKCGDTEVRLPNIDEDIIFVFTHILQHFFYKGIGLRQICDWCRLLWSYKESVNIDLLEKRLLKMGMMSEWKAFAYLAVDKLGMPAETMPFYEDLGCWKNKSQRIVSFMLATGSFGHNRDYSYFKTYPFLVRKAISLYRHTKDTMVFLTIFPFDALAIWWHMVCSGIKGLAIA